MPEKPKPRLKESDEILSSVSRKRPRQQPAILPGDVLPPPIEAMANASAESEDRPKPVRRRRPSAGQEPRPPEPEDRNPLDFGKYELPKKKPRPQPGAADDEDFAAPAAVEIVGASPSRAGTSAPARPEPEPLVFIPDVPEEEAKPARPAILKARQQPETKPPRKPILTVPEAEQAGFTPFEFEDLAGKKSGGNTEAKELREAEREPAGVMAGPDGANREFADDKNRAAEARRKMIEDEKFRETAYRQLGSEFEEAFEQQFKRERKPPEKGGGATPGTAERRLRTEQRPSPELVLGLTLEPEPPLRPVPPRRAAPRQQAGAKPQPGLEPPGPGPDETAAREADSFLELFEEEVRREEEVRTEDFKETLAQKFMRERQRYLEELGIAERMEAEQEKAEREERGRLAELERQPAVEPPRHRRLNLQIRPEMHLGEGEAPPPRPIAPVTYDRLADTRPQEPAEREPGSVIFGPDPGLLAGIQAPASEEDGSPSGKTAEQLVLELGEQNKRRRLSKAGAGKEPAQFNFRFTPAEEEPRPEPEKPGRSLPRLTLRGKTTARVIALSGVACLLVLSLLAWGLSSVLPFGNTAQPDGGGDAPSLTGEPQELYEAYQSFVSSSGQAQFTDVVVKRTGIELGNVTVGKSIVVDETAVMEGGLLLSNVLVGDVIYIKNSGVNALDLVDVQAGRVIINNAGQAVAVTASGNTDIGAVEVRTAASFTQGELSGDAPGIRSVVVRNEDAAESLGFGLNGTQLQALTTQGETAVSFEDASVESMTADGNLSLTGSGRVQNLAAGLGAGQGAGDYIEAQPLSILIKGVDVGHLNIKSPANVNISANVDSMAAADSVNLGGNGTVGSLVLNERFGNARLGVDITGINIQQLTANAETTIYSNGSSTINTLTANRSTYALGNKVNVLAVNADGVIYENEPDVTRVAPGVAKPQTKADNPNLNYSLGGAAAQGASGAENDPLATSCDHSRESGGFLVGDGSRDNPFRVETAAMLAHITQHPGSHYTQTQDIDISEDSGFAGGFPMICAEGTRFSGSYDGGGYAVKNLRINGGGEYTGLFAENTGTIQNLRIEGGEISGASRSFTGAVAGFNYQGGQVIACSNGANILSSDGAYTGGIVGYNYGGKIRDCYNTAKISGGDFAGGIVGMNRQGASVTGSYNAGLVEGGGVFGAIAGSNEDGAVANCYFLGSMDEDGAGGVGSGVGNTVKVTSETLASAQTALSLAAGSDQSLWQQSTDSGYPYPVLRRPSGGASVPAALPEQTPAETPSEPESAAEEDGGDYQTATYQD